MQGTQWRKAKSMQAHSPKNGPASRRKPRNVSKGAGMPVLFCSKHARLNFDCHKQCKDMCTASGMYSTLGATPGTPRHQSWLTSALCKAATPGKAARLTGFCEWQRWFLGSGAIFACACPHTSRGSNVKLAIRIGLGRKTTKNVLKSY